MKKKNRMERCTLLLPFSVTKWKRKWCDPFLALLDLFFLFSSFSSIPSTQSLTHTFQREEYLPFTQVSLLDGRVHIEKREKDRWEKRDEDEWWMQKREAKRKRIEIDVLWVSEKRVRKICFLCEKVSISLDFLFLDPSLNEIGGLNLNKVSRNRFL